MNGRSRCDTEARGATIAAPRACRFQWATPTVEVTGAHFIEPWTAGALRPATRAVRTASLVRFNGGQLQQQSVMGASFTRLFGCAASMGG